MQYFDGLHQPGLSMWLYLLQPIGLIYPATILTYHRPSLGQEPDTLWSVNPRILEPDVQYLELAEHSDNLYDG